MNTDYLIVGAGAMGLAFADSLIANSADCTVTIVDRHHRPGGHWNDAYGFVRLHQPSAFYGVNSRPLGEDSIDKTGLNAGLLELASGSEVCAYFDQVMQKQLLASGRVQYFPLCEYRGNGCFISLLSGKEQRITVNRKTVDATYSATEVPSTHKPNFPVDDAVNFVPPNALPTVNKLYQHYIIIGAGKTAVDTVLWLLINGVDAGKIIWIISRDMWLLNRVHYQPGQLGTKARSEAVARQLELIIESESVSQLFESLNQEEILLRIDDNIEPSMYKCATVTQAELNLLRQVKNTVRKGRVKALTADRIVLGSGEIALEEDSLVIDCSAKGLPKRQPLPVFGNDTITLQILRLCQPTFSAAFIGFLKATEADVATKNKLANVIPYPDEPIDWLSMLEKNMANQFIWNQHSTVRNWIQNSRLNVSRGNSGDETFDKQVSERIKTSIGPALKKLQGFLSAS